jgi:hypothetical protein
MMTALDQNLESVTLNAKKALRSRSACRFF